MSRRQSTKRYPGRIRERLLAVSGSRCDAAEISRLNFELGELYTSAVRSTCVRGKVPLGSVELIGCHGQTIAHGGDEKPAHTLQIGEASVIVERLGIPVVSDFRTRDIAAGGHGAPLVPFADWLLFGDRRESRVALNIGGIANITVLPGGSATDDVIAFDTGPGNMVIDQLVAIHTKGKQTYDRAGGIAATGRIDRALLERLLNDRYYAARPPKTAGREQYGAEFVRQLLGTKRPLPDLIATATALTAATIALGVRMHARSAKTVIAAGGGVHNRYLMAHIAALLPGCRIARSDEFGVDPDFREAIAFAVLAWRTWNGKSGNLPSATGARRPVPLGKITRA